MTYSTKVPISPPATARGIHYTPDADYFYFVRSDGVYRALAKPAVVTQQTYGSTLTNSKTFDLNGVIGTKELRWSASTLYAQYNATIVALSGFTTLDQITIDTLVNAAYGNTSNNNVPEPGTTQETQTNIGGKFYAVKIPAAASSPDTDIQYAKVRVYTRNNAKYIDWVTYRTDPNPTLIVALGGDLAGKAPRDVVVSPDEEAIYVSAVDPSTTPSTGGVWRIGRTQDGPFPVYDAGGSVSLHATDLTEPQQIILSAGLIYAVDKSAVWVIDPDAYATLPMVTGLTDGVGLLFDTTNNGTKAYIAEASGAVRVAPISDYDPDLPPQPIPAPNATLTIGGAPGFLAWTDDTHTAFYAPDRTHKRVVQIDLARGGVADEELTGSATPWGVAVISPNQRYVSSDTEIGLIDRSITVNGTLLLGIGLVPFTYINNSALKVAPTWPPGPNDGKADTSSAQNYYFWQYPNLPFGGTLSLMLNHALARSNNIQSYAVTFWKLDPDAPLPTLPTIPGSKPYDKGFTDMLWNKTSSRWEPQTRSPSPSTKRFDVRGPDELWYNPYLAATISTSDRDNGYYVLLVEFFNQGGTRVDWDAKLILIDNTPYKTALAFPRIGTPLPNSPPTLDCGCITYATKNDLVAVDFAAWQPQGVGTYTLSFQRGSTSLGTLNQSGTVSQSSTQPALQPKTEATPGTPFKVGHLLGDCDIANIQISINSASHVIDGFGWVNLGSTTTRSFTLVKGPLTHTPWP